MQSPLSLDDFCRDFTPPRIRLCSVRSFGQPREDMGMAIGRPTVIVSESRERWFPCSRTKCGAVAALIPSPTARRKPEVQAFCAIQPCRLPPTSAWPRKTRIRPPAPTIPA